MASAMLFQSYENETSSCFGVVDRGPGGQRSAGADDGKRPWVERHHEPFHVADHPAFQPGPAAATTAPSSETGPAADPSKNRPTHDGAAETGAAGSAGEHDPRRHQRAAADHPDQQQRAVPTSAQAGVDDQPGVVASLNEFASTP